MNQTNHFFDLGYGWLCKHCSAADAERKNHHAAVNANIFSQDEPDRKGSTSGLALARWTDSTHHALACPRCGIEETITSV